MPALNGSVMAALLCVGGCSDHLDYDAGEEWSVTSVWELVEPARVTIGGHDTRHAYALSRVMGAVITESRNIVVADGDSDEIRFYDPDGGLIAVAGGSGFGPGEFNSIWSVHHSANQVVVWDRGARRSTTFDDSGRLVGTSLVEWPDDGSFPPPAIDQIVGILPDGSMVAINRTNPFVLRDHPSGEHLDTLTYGLFGSDGSFTQVITKARRSEQWLFNEGNSWGTVQVIFGGETMAAVAGDNLVVGWSRAVAVHAIDRSGDTVRTIPLPFESAAVTSRDVTMARESFLQRSADRYARSPNHPSAGRLAEAARRRLGKVGYKETMPRFSALVADADGNVWIGEYARPGESMRRWLIVDRVGSNMSAIDIPTSIEVLYISGDNLLGLTRDELDLETVGLYVIRK